MSDGDQVREEIDSSHPFYEEAMTPGYLEGLPVRAVGYLWKTCVGKQEWSAKTFENLVTKGLVGMDHRERQGQAELYEADPLGLLRDLLEGVGFRIQWGLKALFGR